MEYASKGVANAGLATGIIGTTLGVLNGGLGNILGMGNNCVAQCSENMPVNRYELDMAMAMSAKDQEIALLKADKYTDEKLVQVYKDLNSQVMALKDEQNAINLQQATYNATCNATMSCIQQQIATLNSITKVVIPNTSVCPGWGNVTITPATTTTASAG